MNYFTSEINSINNNHNFYKLSKQIELMSPQLKVLFPIQERYGQIQIKLEFNNIKENLKIKEFYILVQKIEHYYYNKICKFTNKNLILKSQINQFKNFNPFLIVKVPMVKKKPNIFIENKKNKLTTIYDIKQNDFINSTIFIDNIWVSNKNEVFIKWKFKKIFY